MKTPEKKKRVPQILPREPLTEKAKKGIEAYAVHRCKGLTIYTLLIKYTLEAERMRRVDLYAWLKDHGYVWEVYGRNRGYWYQPKEKA